MGWISIGAGVLLVVGLALLTRGANDQPDPSMRYEGMVAVGFGALLLGVPIWLVQVVTAVVGGALAHSGRVWLVLLVWAFLAPGVAATAPAIQLAQRDPD